jgi:ADP-ribose pyrophosphatase YjhB (NUDIX family)
MPPHPQPAQGEVLRHFTVAVFVVWQGLVLLHYHPRLRKWLPPGGHIEESELPDDAAVREVFEETGVRCRLVGAHGLTGDIPRQLIIPAGVQVENIYPGHQHIDLVYFAIPDPRFPNPERIDPILMERDQVGWHRPTALERLGASDEISAWARRAVTELSELAVAEPAARYTYESKSE